MNAKEYLEQIETLDIKIRQMEEQLECMRETAGGAAAIRYDKENVQVSVVSDIVERNVIRLIEMQEKIFAEKVRLEALKNTIVEQIQSLDDNRYIQILYLRYVKQEKFLDISKQTDYDYDYVRVLHGEALGYFEMRYQQFFKHHTQTHIDTCYSDSVNS